jgi:hypothetical protein
MIRDHEIYTTTDTLSLHDALPFRPGHESPFTRAIDRLNIFGLAQTYANGLAVRTRVPPLSDRYLSRLPRYLRDAHGGYVA